MREGTIDEYRAEMNNALTRLSMVRDKLRCLVQPEMTCRERSNCACDICELWRGTGREPEIV